MRLVAFLLFAHILLAGSVAAAEKEVLRTFYEITLVEGGRTIAILRSSNDVTFGVPIVREAGRFTLSLLFESSDSEQTEDYALTLTLRPKLNDEELTALEGVTQIYQGRISSSTEYSQIEFTESSENLSISGALRLSRVN